MMQSYHSNRRERKRTKSRAQRSSSSGGSVHNIRDASESTVFQQRARPCSWRLMASSADRRAGDGTPAPRGECSDQRLVAGRPTRCRRQRVVDGVPATHCTRRQPASGGSNRPSPTSSCRTRRTFRNRAVRQTAATKPQNQQRAQLSSDGDDDMMLPGGGCWYCSTPTGQNTCIRTRNSQT